MKEILTPGSKVRNEISLGFNTNRDGSQHLIESMAYEIEHAKIMGKYDRGNFEKGLKNIEKHGAFYNQAFYIHISTDVREPEKYVKRILKILAKKYKKENLSCKLRYVVYEEVYDKKLGKSFDVDPTYVEFDFSLKTGRVKQNYADFEPYSVRDEDEDKPLEFYKNLEW